MESGQKIFQIGKIPEHIEPFNEMTTVFCFYQSSVYPILSHSHHL